MALSVGKPGGWALNERLTSAQMNAIKVAIERAVDGVAGGTYTLSSPLEFQGADVRIGGDLEVLSTGELNVQSGGELNLQLGSVTTLAGLANVTGDIELFSGASLNALSGSAINVGTGANLAVSGFITVGPGGQIVVANLGSMTFNDGSTLGVTGGAHLIVDAASFLDLAGNLEVSSGGNVILGNGADLVVSSGAHILAGAGALVRMAAPADLAIHNAPEGFRTPLVPFGYSPSRWAARVVDELVWEQLGPLTDHPIVFPIIVPPGDTLIDVYVRLNGENGHGDLPDTMPVVRLVRAAVDGSFTTIAKKTDPSPDVATYESHHYVILQAGGLDAVDGGSMPVLATSEPFYLIINGEAGDHSEAGLEVVSITGNLTARSYRTSLAIR